MFSALKFVVAAAIVALFGGFLLAGVLTTQQDGEVPPAAVTESPSPMTSEELLSGMVTEEVEPGVFRVVNDGVRNLTGPLVTTVGQDGSVWVMGKESFRLGGDSHDLPIHISGVTPNGTVWGRLSRVEPGQDAIGMFDGQGWMTRTTVPVNAYAWVEVALDGTVWGSWPDPTDEDKTVLARYGADGWERMQQTPPGEVQRLLVAGNGDMWAIHGPSNELSRYADGEWRTVVEQWVVRAAISNDGRLWVLAYRPRTDAFGRDLRRANGQPKTITYLIAINGDEWREWGPDDGVPTGASSFFVAPDGGAAWFTSPSTKEEPVCGDGGVLRFDGTTWDRYLADLCSGGPAGMGPDGSFWVVAGEGNGNQKFDGLYVITPEAVAGSE